MPQAELDVDWPTIERLAITGIPMEELAKRYEIGAGTIRKRAFDKKWPIPSKIKRLAREQGLKVTDGNESLKIAAESLQERAEAYSLTIFNKVSSLAKKGLSNVPIPQNWKELDTADRMARRAAGLDKPAQNVQINLGGLFRPAEQMEEGVVLDVESETESDSSDSSPE